MDVSLATAYATIGASCCCSYVLGRQKQHPALIAGCISVFVFIQYFPDYSISVLTTVVLALTARASSFQSEKRATVIVGSSNPAKVEAVRDAMTRYRRVVVTSCAAPSGVSEQPIGFDEISAGARNRAEACHSPGAWLSFGIESGLFVLGEEGAYDVCCVSAFDGEKHSLGFSCAFEIPPKAKDAVFNRGLDLSQAANEVGLSSDKNVGKKGGLVAVLTGGRVTRKDYTIQAIDMAMVRVEHPSWYLDAPSSTSVMKGR